ncbi:diguanylate cyclase [Halomonas sp. HP20-15]|uniref:diguanylate cyclase n=1 Tax=Halomonas sp. HP20-15 TaxID=3085901 RepID=UPI0029816C9B|nr:diguanylate cyclase [Halomonas sp. HP20-15]MDW5377493.1 diguanylate cyclase [Halomonas sp. HP20-15]
MEHNPVDIVQERLRQLREEYSQWLVDELAALATDAEELAGGGDRDAVWLTIRDRLHKLAGGAGTFGFVDLGEACRALEIQLDEALATSSPSSLAEVRCGVMALPGFLEPARASIEPAKPVSALTVQTALTAPDATSAVYPRVYILEDDEALGRQLCQILASFHYAATLFVDGLALQRACRERCPDALILDLHFADDGGAEGLAIGEAIQHETTVQLPIFATEESQRFDVQLRAVRAGVVGFLARPLDPIRLAEMLEVHLRGHRAAPMRVLMVDDDASTLDYHRLVLETAGFAVTILDRPELTLEVMESFAPDVLVLDVRMPQCSGPELAQIVRYHSRWLQVPIVYLSASGDARAQLTAMTKAGDDFMVKPIAPEALVAAVTARARRARTLAMALSCDGLTGLLKHADIKEQLSAALAQARRRQQPLCVVMLDIDHFKRVNDTYGHLVGDEVIRALASLLDRRLRESDLIGRYGGEEFLLVLNDCEEPQAVRVVDELREAFARFSFLAEQQSFACTYSAGVLQANAEHDVEALIGKADQRLYLAKSEGRNRVVAG